MRLQTVICRIVALAIVATAIVAAAIVAASLAVVPMTVVPLAAVLMAVVQLVGTLVVAGTLVAPLVAAVAPAAPAVVAVTPAGPLVAAMVVRVGLVVLVAAMVVWVATVVRVARVWGGSLRALLHSRRLPRQPLLDQSRSRTWCRRRRTLQSSVMLRGTPRYIHQIQRRWEHTGRTKDPDQSCSCKGQRWSLQRSLTYPPNKQIIGWSKHCRTRWQGKTWDTAWCVYGCLCRICPSWNILFKFWNMTLQL